jgi:hypothetical protein
MRSGKVSEIEHQAHPSTSTVFLIVPVSSGTCSLKPQQ